MALSTALKKIEKAKQKYADELAVISSELADALTKEIAPSLPKGWSLHWHQSDQMYNDEDYYFGTTGPWLISDREPRQGRLVKEEVPRKYAEYTNVWGTKERIVTEYGSPAEYEWILDKNCPERDEVPELRDTPGVICLDEFDEEFAAGLPEAEVDRVSKLFRNIDEDVLRQAFGDQAEVTVRRDGTWEKE